MKVLVVFGTRPEAIKMCPLVLELKEKKEIDCVVCLSGQHKEMLTQVMETFKIKEDYNLGIMKDRQSLTSITMSVLEKMEPILLKEKPDLVLVHGDTTTSYAAALAAFYQKIPVGHVEAGLRTGNIYSPFPEEMNRMLIDRICTYYYAPTEENADNLKREGIFKNIYVTGNTVIDSFKYTVKENYEFSNAELKKVILSKQRIVTVTAHRRENWGQPLCNVCKAIKRLAEHYDDIEYVYPVHLNPAVKDVVYGYLEGVRNVHLIDPIDVLDMHNLLSRSFFVLTDSGGLQEEGPHFGKPVLVLRTETERPEAVRAGTVKVIGTDEDIVYAEASRLIEDTSLYERMARAINPYGDGKASERICDAILKECRER